VVFSVLIYLKFKSGSVQASRAILGIATYQGRVSMEIDSRVNSFYSPLATQQRSATNEERLSSGTVTQQEQPTTSNPIDEPAQGSEAWRRKVLASATAHGDSGVILHLSPRIVELTPEQKEFLARTDAEQAAREAVFAQGEQEVARSLKYVENNSISLSNISTLSLGHAKTQVGIVELKITNREDVGMTVSGRYGDQKISDLNTYLAALKDHIGKLESSAAASVYRQVQDMGNAGTK
jgi:hypothetical protein